MAEDAPVGAIGLFAEESADDPVGDAGEKDRRAEEEDDDKPAMAQMVGVRVHGGG